MGLIISCKYRGKMVHLTVNSKMTIVLVMSSQVGLTASMV